MPPAAAVLAQATSVSEMRESLFQRVFASAAAPPPSLYDQLGGPGKVWGPTLPWLRVLRCCL